MTDTYQAVYDAARSRMSNGDIGSAVQSAVTSQLGSASHYLEELRDSYLTAANEMQRPSVLYRPQLIADLGHRPSGRWCATYGALTTYGHTPEDAMVNFDKAWKERL